MRVSLAIGIIKSKPDGSTGLEYAEELQRRVKDDQRIWKDEYLRIKTELLEVKQTQILASLDKVQGYLHV